MNYSIILSIEKRRKFYEVEKIISSDFDNNNGYLNATGYDIVGAGSIIGRFCCLKKELIPAGNGQPARLKLEAYVKGMVSASSGGRPTDIIMVLDQSGSMDDSIATSQNTSSSKLAIMKDAVQDFAEEVAELNVNNDDRYRIAVVGFASEDTNTEVLTSGLSKSQIENGAEYDYVEINSSLLDQTKNY